MNPVKNENSDLTPLKPNSKSHGYRSGLLYLSTRPRLKNEDLFINRKQNIYRKSNRKSIEFRIRILKISKIEIKMRILFFIFFF